MKIKIEKCPEWIIRQCKNKEVLDVGVCGDICSLSVHSTLRKITKSVLGIDINKEGVKKAKRLGYNVIYGDVECYVSNKKHEVVFASDVIEHLNNPGLFLDCVKKNLKKDGKLVLTTPNVRHPHEWLTMKAYRSDHVHLYNALSIGNLLRGYDYNYKIYYLEGYPTSLKGKIYVTFLLPIFPKFARIIGVEAWKKG